MDPALDTVTLPVMDKLIDQVLDEDQFICYGGSLGPCSTDG